MTAKVSVECFILLTYKKLLDLEQWDLKTMKDQLENYQLNA